MLVLSSKDFHTHLLAFHSLSFMWFANNFIIVDCLFTLQVLFFPCRVIFSSTESCLNFTLQKLLLLTLKPRTLPRPMPCSSSLPFYIESIRIYISALYPLWISIHFGLLPINEHVFSSQGVLWTLWVFCQFVSKLPALCQHLMCLTFMPVPYPFVC